MFYLSNRNFKLRNRKQISPKYTLQGDVFISAVEIFRGHKPVEVLLYFCAEGRYIFTEAFKHWYVGANVSVVALQCHKMELLE